MNIWCYIILGWLVFIGLIYAYLFYDIHIRRINIRQRWKNLVEVFTEEE